MKKEIMKLDDQHLEAPSELIDPGNEQQWLPTSQKERWQAVCLLMKKYTITYSLAKGIEDRANPAANLEKIQTSEVCVEPHHEYAIGKI